MDGYKKHQSSPKKIGKIIAFNELSRKPKASPLKNSITVDSVSCDKSNPSLTPSKRINTAAEPPVSKECDVLSSSVCSPIKTSLRSSPRKLLTKSPVKAESLYVGASRKGINLTAKRSASSTIFLV